MQIDTLSLLAASGINAVLGVAYWGAATRHYGVAEVGRASTLINSALLLASLANLSLGPLYERFLPVAGSLQRRLILAGQVITAALAGLFAAVFLAVGPGELANGHDLVGLLFLFAVPTLATFSLLDAILVGLRSGRWAAAKNTFHAMSKLVLAILFAGIGTATALVSSWVIPSLGAVVVIEILLLSRIGPLRQDRRATPELPERKALGAFTGWAMAWMLAQTLPGLLIPLIVVSQRGLADAAFFNISWTIVAASILLMALVTGPYVAEASRRPSRSRWELTRTLATNLVLINIVRALLVGAVGPIVLYLYGREYFSAGTPLLLVMACCQLISTVGYLYASIARVSGKIGFPTVVQLLGTGGLLLVVPVLVTHWGIVGVGVGYLVHDVVLALVIAPKLIKALRSEKAVNFQVPVRDN
ncbi:lipopolysaccharide biosynthesis protein [Gordonia crocea]|uniref:Polysaccharide biosynthesis protein n=1 Tax=Gordonia crocea TaxID=589162 RepID=A0A7I9V081_9ACTN|nr:hypothetical protein [Gordonia crocea]GED98553.1 hypothetical protein nbrc107697_25920 [Gordonia crocea]